jgi:beta-phosphoglucomutase family hydrolase
MEWTAFEAALFDLDGVITPTAQVHMRAWSEMFNDFLAAEGVTRPYSDEDYFAYVDGRPRYDGVREFLRSRDIALPEGSPDDSASTRTICGLGNRKNDMFNTVLERDGVEPYPGSVALIDHLDRIGVGKAVVSSSNNAQTVLDAAGLGTRFSVVVSGVVASRQGLPGKPAPDTYSYAAGQLGTTNAKSVVLEDAVSGVRAGRAGDFGLVVGVDRGAGADVLRGGGADVVVDDLAELVP